MFSYLLRKVGTGGIFSLFSMVVLSVKMQIREAVVGQIALHQRRNLEL